MKKVTFKKVKSLYQNHMVLGVREAWKEGIGWFTSFNDKKISEQGTPEQQINFCQQIGATNVQLHLEGKLHRLTHKTFPDYKISELEEV